MAVIADPDNHRLPPLARQALILLVSQLCATQERIAELEKELTGWHRCREASRRLAAIPGVGIITATALVATVGDATAFRSARQFAAWLGLVPRQQSSGGKYRLGRISKRGDGYLRRLLVHGARTVLAWSRRRKQTLSDWLRLSLRAGRPMSRWLPWPTRRPASSGPCSADTKTTCRTGRHPLELPPGRSRIAKVTMM